MPLAGGIANFKTGRRFAIAGFQAGGRCKAQNQPPLLTDHRFDHRPSGYDLFSVNLLRGNPCQPFPNRLFVVRVDVRWMAEIQGDGHAGVRQGVVYTLLVGAESRPVGAFQGGELHKEERQIRPLPLSAPVGDQRFQNGIVLLHAPIAFRVGFTLIPQHAGDPLPDEGRHGGVPHKCRLE